MRGPSTILCYPREEGSFLKDERVRTPASANWHALSALMMPPPPYPPLSPSGYHNPVGVVGPVGI